MAERRAGRPRSIGMRTLPPGLALVMALGIIGCGDEDADDDAATPTASTSYQGCASAANPPPLAQLDLDGDGAAESVTYSPRDATCPAFMSVALDGHELSVDLDDELPVTSDDVHAVAIPGRTGDVLLLTPQHPRGGFQARLFGYADGELAELTVDGRPIFPFVATDVTTTPLSARCVPGGFEVLEAKAHEPIGVLAAWDVFRTAYTVDGNTVTMGERTEVADNVLDEELSKEYRPLTRYRLFDNCLTAR